VNIVRRRKFRIRSRATIKGWNTRTRREGMRQIGKAVIARSSQIVSNAKLIKDVSIGTCKIVAPRGYRRNRPVKKIDKYL
jgi:hypothetical protein